MTLTAKKISRNVTPFSLVDEYQHLIRETTRLHIQAALSSKTSVRTYVSTKINQIPEGGDVPIGCCPKSQALTPSCLEIIHFTITMAT
jgi:hypothetical protein